MPNKAHAYPREKILTPASQTKFFAAVRADLRRHKVRHSGFLWSLVYLVTIPGFLAAFLYRLSALCVAKGGVMAKLARLIWRLNLFLTSCEISPLAKIGSGLFLPHPMGIVVGELAVAGDDLTLLQHVTLGQRVEGLDERSNPQLGCGVVVSAGAVLLGDIKIGDYAVIGANAVVLQNVPDHCTAVGVPARILPPRNAAV